VVYLALQVQSPLGLSAWQFLLAVAVAPVATIVALLWTWSMNNRRAEQVKTELSRYIDDLGVRVTELKSDLSGEISKTGLRVTELKTDINAQMGALKTDLTGQAAQLRSDVGAMKSDIKNDIGAIKHDVGEMKSDIKAWVKTEMEGGFAKVEIQIVRNQSELVQLIGKRHESATAD
jgi:hypothetical protein